MSNGIVLTSAIRQNLLTLQNTTEMQGKVQERLSTGKKVNTALDNPTNFFTAASLTRRATDLSTLLDGMANGIKTLEAADKGMKAITSTVETMRAYVRQARQDKSFKGQSYTLDAARTGNVTFSGGAVGTTPRTVSIGPTQAAAATTLTGVGGAFGGSIPSGTVTVNGQNVAIRGDVAAVASSVTASGGVDYTADPNLSALDTQTITVTATNGNTRTYTFTAGANGQAAALETALEGGAQGFTVTLTNDGIDISRADGVEFTVTTSNAAVATSVGIANNTTTSNGTEAFDATVATVEADFDGAGITGLTAAQVGGQIQLSLASGADITLGGADATLTALGFAAGAGRSSTNGTEAVYATLDTLVNTINNDVNLTGKVRASNDGGKLRIENLSTESLTVGGVGNDGELDGTAGTGTISGNDVRKNLLGQFNDLRKQLDKLASDGSYNGINLVKADKLKISFNETGTSSIEIQAKNVAGTVRGIGTEASSLNIAEADATEFSDDANLDARLDALNSSLTTLQTQSSSFGAALTTVQTRQEFTKAMINTLQQGADGLTLADSNEEGANLLALNTRQQLSQTALSLASQASQAVLRLF